MPDAMPRVRALVSSLPAEDAAALGEVLECYDDAERRLKMTAEQMVNELRVRRMHFEQAQDSEEWRLEQQVECEWLREWLSHAMVQLLGDAPNYIVWTIGFGCDAPEKVAGKQFDVWIQRVAGEPLAAKQSRLAFENAQLQARLEVLSRATPQTGQQILAPYRKPGASYAKLSPAKLDALNEAIAAAVLAERVACLQAVLDERLCDPNPESATDEAYDRAIRDAARAICARGVPEKGEGE